MGGGEIQETSEHPRELHTERKEEPQTNTHPNSQRAESRGSERPNAEEETEAGRRQQQGLQRTRTTETGGGRGSEEEVTFEDDFSGATWQKPQGPRVGSVWAEARTRGRRSPWSTSAVTEQSGIVTQADGVSGSTDPSTPGA